MTVLVIDDEVQIRKLLQITLENAGYRILQADNGRQGLVEAALGRPDVIVLDLSLPDGDGLALLQEWRKGGFNEPVLILSARDAVQDRIKGLDVGADDYLSKPFSLEELLARVRSLLRRQTAVKETVLEHHGIRMDLLGRTVTNQSQPVELTSREFALLEIFLQNPGRILTRTLISEKIWESHYDVDTNLLDVYMSKLRAKLETAPDKPIFKTIRGVGYQLL